MNKEIWLTENQHDGPEEIKGEEHLSVVDKRVIWVVLRVHLSCKCHTGDNIHSEAAKTPENRTKLSNLDCVCWFCVRFVGVFVFTCECQRLPLTQHRRSSYSSGRWWLCWWVEPSTGNTKQSITCYNRRLKEKCKTCPVLLPAPHIYHSICDGNLTRQKTSLM